MKKSLIAAALFGASLTPAAALAQDAPPPTVTELLVVGATVYGPEGAEVGKIEEMPDGNVVLFTGTNRATLPATSFGRNDKGLVIAMTKTQLDNAVAAAAAQADAAINAALVPAAKVSGSDGVEVGAVQKVEGDNVTLDLTSGSAIVLPKSQFQAAAGGLSLFMTSAEFAAAVKAATAPASAEPAPAATETVPAAN